MIVHAQDRGGSLLCKAPKGLLAMWDEDVTCPRCLRKLKRIGPRKHMSLEAVRREQRRSEKRGRS